MKSRIIRGIGANTIGRVIGVCSAFCLPPMFLQTWGIEGYGDWVLLASIAAYLGISDFGGQLYVVNRLTQAFSDNRVDEFRAILHTGLAMFLVIPSSMYVLFCALLLMVNPAEVLGLSSVGRDVATFVMLILAFRFIISLPQGLLLGVYRAVGLLPRGVMLGNIMAVLLLSFTLFTLMFGCSITTVAAVQTLPMLIVGMMGLYDLNKKFTYLDIVSFKYVDLGLGKKFVRPSLGFFLMYLAQAFSVQGIIILVGVLFNSVQVVIFSTVRTVANFLLQPISIISHSIWPELTRLDVKKDWKRMMLLMRLMLRSSLLFALAFAIIIHYYGEIGYGFWLGDKVEYDQKIMDLLLVYVIQSLYWTLCGNLLMATNKHAVWSKVVILNSILTIILAWVLGKIYGLYGVALGMIASDFLLPVLSVQYLLRKTWPTFTYAFFIKETLPVLIAIGISLLGPWHALIAFILFVGWWILGFRQVKHV